MQKEMKRMSRVSANMVTSDSWCDVVSSPDPTRAVGSGDETRCDEPCEFAKLEQTADMQ